MLEELLTSKDLTSVELLFLGCPREELESIIRNYLIEDLAYDEDTTLALIKLNPSYEKIGNGKFKANSGRVILKWSLPHFKEDKEGNKHFVPSFGYDFNSVTSEKDIVNFIINIIFNQYSYLYEDTIGQGDD